MQPTGCDPAGPGAGPDTGRLAAAFGLREVSAASLTRFARVHRGRTPDGLDVVVKRTDDRTSTALVAWTTRLAHEGVAVVAPVGLRTANPQTFATADGPEETWVVYPFVHGEVYRGTPTQIRAAGELLGRVHAADAATDATTGGLRAYAYPDTGAGDVEADLETLRALVRDRAGARSGPLAEHIASRARSWLVDVLPALRAVDAAGDLPRVAATDDFKAANLVFADSGPTIIDPDNGGRVPRVLDLALSAVLFHHECATAPGRLFTTDEWRVFLAGYETHVELTGTERRWWAAAFLHQWWEEGTWALEDADDQAWSDARDSSFLLSLAAADARHFPV